MILHYFAQAIDHDQEINKIQIQKRLDSRRKNGFNISYGRPSQKVPKRSPKPCPARRSVPKGLALEFEWFNTSSTGLAEPYRQLANANLKRRSDSCRKKQLTTVRAEIRQRRNRSRESSMTFEVLHLALVLFGLGSSRKRSQIPTASCFSIDLA